jgi:ATPase subunit of ABC transporter with duplicated ATPase domains
VYFHELAAGTIRDFPKHIYVHHCKEIELHPGAQKVIDTVVNAHEFRTVLLECEEKLKAQIATETDDAKLTGLKSNLEYVDMYITKIQGRNAYDRASKMLRVLGFDEGGQQKSTNDLSGGLRMRVALCAAFFVEADLLLLDEPNNHLDFPSVLWLENRLRGHRGAFLMVCHDRHLLNAVCTSVVTIEEKKLNFHGMTFADFEKKREITYKKKSEEIDKFLIKYRNVDFSSPLAKERAEKKAWSDSYQARMVLLAGKFVFPDPKPLPEMPGHTQADIPLVTLTQVTFSYKVETGIWIFKDPIDLEINTSSRMGLMGPNGAGKSTLLKLICDKIKPVTGTITRHPTATVAYFAQHHVMDLDMSMTAMEYMIKEFPEVEKTGLLRSHLAKVGIVGDKSESRMSGLSAGLRSCVVFARITYYCPHLLIMDEPTNFLDLESVDSLIAATNKFTGALLLVSHNRGFLLKCAKRFISVVPGKFSIYDDLKTCERATYQFIEEMESGVRVDTQNLVKNNPSADAANSVREDKAKMEAEKVASMKGADGTFTFSATPAVVKKPAVTVSAETKDAKIPEVAVGKACQAVWKDDGKTYNAVITKVLEKGQVEISFTGYGTIQKMPASELIFKKAAPAAAAPAKGKAVAGKK